MTIHIRQFNDRVTSLLMHMLIFSSRWFTTVDYNYNVVITLKCIFYNEIDECIEVIVHSCQRESSDVCLCNCMNIHLILSSVVCISLNSTRKISSSRDSFTNIALIDILSSFWTNDV
jgi:hypothetical protein